MTKHIPGPWISDGETIDLFDFELENRRFWITADGMVIGYVDGFGNEERKANARLIAFAPDLFEALRDAVDYYPNWKDGTEPVWRPKARAAIAKASVESNNKSHLHSAKHSADSADSFCQQELYNLQSVAGRMALELECLLLDTKDLAVVSRWWDTGMEALQAYRDHIWSVTHGKDGESND